MGSYSTIVVLICSYSYTLSLIYRYSILYYTVILFVNVLIWRGIVKNKPQIMQ